ncbi:MAG: hypothetical protein JKX94_09825 [Sneathiella sp.]|nr:hypothetical protein [Sneathiella sp.]
MRNILFFIGVLFTVSTVQAFAAEQSGPYQSSFFGTAAEGYDVVAYFVDGKAKEGDSDLEYKWKDVSWRFATKANREAFIADPEKYAPQYGGYCAYAVSQGYTASIDPQAWSVVDGKLYLNYSKSVQATWKEDIPGYISAANDNWPTIKKSL